MHQIIYNTNANINEFIEQYFYTYTLTKICCNYFNLTEFPILPPNLEILYCANNNLTELPELPPKLIKLWCI